MKIQTYLIKELAEIEGVQKPTIHSWIDKGIILPVSFRLWLTKRRSSVRYFSRHVSALLAKDLTLAEICEMEEWEVRDLEEKRMKEEKKKKRVWKKKIWS